MRKVLIAVIVLIIVLVAADRIAVLVAERQISDRVASAYSLPAKPGVSIKGFPFLTQVAAGKYQQVDISVPHVAAGGVTVSNLDARFTEVDAPVSAVLGHGASSVTAKRASATATVALAAVQARLPHGLALRRDGSSLAVSGTAHYAGLAIPVSATVTPRASSSGGISLTPSHVSVGGGITVPASAISGRLVIVLPVGPLPLHLKITSVRVGSAGLRISAAGTDVHFASVR
jgi:hypothetical protein